MSFSDSDPLSDQVARLMVYLDARGNGLVERDDLVRVMKRHNRVDSNSDLVWERRAQGAIYRLNEWFVIEGVSSDNLFDELDVSHNGEVSRGELQEGLSRLAPGVLSFCEFEAILKAMDPNGASPHSLLTLTVVVSLTLLTLAHSLLACTLTVLVSLNLCVLALSLCLCYSIYVHCSRR